jgi:nicotinate-nucleotide adenylyltransferase
MLKPLCRRGVSRVPDLHLVSVPLRIGLFGGTFDPPHVGHIAAAVNVRHALGLDVVRMVVANDPYQKSATRDISPADARMEMVRAACEGIPGLEVSDVEITRGGPSYTFDTVRELHNEHPDAEVFVIIGSDTASRLETWHKWNELADMVTFVVIARDVEELTLPSTVDLVRVDVPVIECSSTELRRRLCDGDDTTHLLSQSVVDVIHAHNLYGVNDRRSRVSVGQSA